MTIKERLNQLFEEFENKVDEEEIYQGVLMKATTSAENGKVNMSVDDVIGYADWCSYSLVYQVLGGLVNKNDKGEFDDGLLNIHIKDLEEENRKLKDMFTEKLAVIVEIKEENKKLKKVQSLSAYTKLVEENENLKERILDIQSVNKEEATMDIMEENEKLKDKVADLEEENKKLKDWAILTEDNKIWKKTTYLLSDECMKLEKKIKELEAKIKILAVSDATELEADDFSDDGITRTVVKQRLIKNKWEGRMDIEEFTEEFYYIYKEAFKYCDSTLEVFEDLKKYPQNKINR